MGEYHFCQENYREMKLAPEVLSPDQTSAGQS